MTQSKKTNNAQVDVAGMIPTNDERHYSYKTFETDKGKVTFTFCLVVQPKYSQVRIGFARLSEKDFIKGRFAKRIGREIALGRAMKDPFNTVTLKKPNPTRTEIAFIAKEWLSDYDKLQAYFNDRLKERVKSKEHVSIRQAQERVIAQIKKLKSKLNGRIYDRFQYDVLELMKND